MGDAHHTSHLLLLLLLLLSVAELLPRADNLLPTELCCLFVTV